MVAGTVVAAGDVTVSAVPVVAVRDIDFGAAVDAVTVVAVAVGCGCSNGGCSR